MFILRNCKFIQELTEGYDGNTGDILIKDDVISQIEHPGYDFGAGIMEYDMSGMTVMPGMYDLHTHISYTGHGDLYDAGRDDYRIVLDTVKHAQACLNAGFTTLRDSGGQPCLCARVKEFIDDGHIVGPNLTVCGRLMSPTELGNRDNLWVKKTIHEVDTYETIRRGVREEIRDGADYIKYVASGAISLRGSNPKIPISTFEEIKMLVEEAAFKGRYVAAHCHDKSSILLCLKAGVKTIEHASILDEECIDILKKRNAYIVPTLSGAGRLKEEGKGETPAYFIRSDADKIRKESFESAKKAYKAGLIMGLGTDTGMPNQFHGENAIELVYRKKYTGLPETELLKQATIYSATILGEQDKRGTVKQGKIADLIVVSVDPVEKIEGLCDSILMVIKSGVIVKSTLQHN